MPLYFLLHDDAILHGEIVPALAAAWRERRFTPCQEVCTHWLPAARGFAERYHTGSAEPLMARVVEGTPFDRSVWRALAGELLWYAAVEAPEVPTAPETLGCLLEAEDSGAVPSGRENLTPIQRAYHGSRDLLFGPVCYRPDAAGLNDVTDVARLAAWLASIDVELWSARSLAGLADVEELDEELEYARQCFAAVRELYVGAAAQGRVVVCETL